VIPQISSSLFSSLCSKAFFFFLPSFFPFPLILLEFLYKVPNKFRSTLVTLFPSNGCLLYTYSSEQQTATLLAKESPMKKFLSESLLFFITTPNTNEKVPYRKNEECELQSAIATPTAQSPATRSHRRGL
jgi:hypothetical protein